MPRRQIQLPGVVQPQPQARPTDQFVQSKVNYPVPKHILDLAKFSPTLTGLITQAQADAHERAFAQGQVDATFAVPFGSSTADTPEMQANRKAFKQEQANGKILPSEDPHYRVGLYTGEGRRAALTMHAALTSEANLQSVSRVYDENGDFIPFEQREDPNAIFDRQSAVFLKTPALKSIYGQQAAAQMVEASRAEFVAKVSHLRDKQTQQYHETQLADQTVEQLERVALAAPDQSPEGLARTEEATEGLHDLIAEWTVKWNLPDGPKVARQGFLAFIDQKAQSDPQAAIEAIDLVRKVKVGPTAVGDDNSDDGVAFRAKLMDLESHYRYAASTEAAREEQNAKHYKTAYMSRVEDGIDERFAASPSPSAAYDKLKVRIENEVERRFQDDAKKLLDEHYSDALKPKPRDTQKDEELDFRIDTQSPEEIAEWIKGLDVSYGQKRDMRGKLQTELETWKGLPEVKASKDAFDAEIKDFAADRSQHVQDVMRDLRNEQVAGANRRIRLKASKLTGEQRVEQMGDIVEAEYAKVTTALSAFKADIHTRSVAFTREMVAANNKGLPFQAEILQAEEDGLITRAQVKTANDDNQEASDISHYTSDERVKGMVQSMFPTSETFNIWAMSGETGMKSWRDLEDGRLLALNMANEWAVKERKGYDSPGAADAGFTEYLNKTIRPAVAKVLGIEGAEKPAGKSSEPGGPTQREEDRADAGKEFQIALSSGSPETLKLAALTAYPTRKGDPKPLVAFQANFGQANGLMPKIRADARKELAATTDPGVRRALLNVGVATPSELLKGEMVVDGVTIQITPADVDIWKTMAFTSTVQFTKAISTDDGTEMLYMIAEKYGISSNEDFDIWIKQQSLLLKVNGL